MANFLRRLSTHEPITSDLIKYSADSSGSVKDAITSTLLRTYEIITTEAVHAQIYQKPGSTASISAPNKQGYNFIAWINAAPSGWKASFGFTAPRSQSTTMYVVANSNGSTDVTTLKDVYAVALYARG